MSRPLPPGLAEPEAKLPAKTALLCRGVLCEYPFRALEDSPHGFVEPRRSIASYRGCCPRCSTFLPNSLLLCARSGWCLSLPPGTKTVASVQSSSWQTFGGSIPERARQAFELDLNIQAVFNLGGLPSVSPGFCFQSESFNLLPKELAVLIPIPDRNLWTSATAPRLIRLDLGNAPENEVTVPFLIAIRHVGSLPLGFPFLLFS